MPMASPNWGPARDVFRDEASTPLGSSDDAASQSRIIYWLCPGAGNGAVQAVDSGVKLPAAAKGGGRQLAESLPIIPREMTKVLKSTGKRNARH